MEERRPGMRLFLPPEATQYFDVLGNHWAGNPELIFDILLDGLGVRNALNAARNEQEVRNVNALSLGYAKLMRGLLMMHIDDLDPNVSGNYRLGFVYPNMSPDDERKKRVTLSKVIFGISYNDDPTVLSPDAQIPNSSYKELQSSIHERIGGDFELSFYLYALAFERP